MYEPSREKTGLWFVVELGLNLPASLHILSQARRKQLQIGGHT